MAGLKMLEKQNPFIGWAELYAIWYSRSATALQLQSHIGYKSDIEHIWGLEKGQNYTHF